MHCFGVSTASGEALRNLVGNDLLGYSRKSSDSCWLYPADLRDPHGFKVASQSSDPSVWISFAPIWLFAPFLKALATYQPGSLKGLRGVIACSSSSAVTKRFAFNGFDRDLVCKLISSEDQLISTCHSLSIPCVVLRPTMIYGRVGPYVDRNVSRLLLQLRRLPLLPLPAQSGLRQPIHASQLAAVTFNLAKRLSSSNRDFYLPERILVGGDTTLTYSRMITALQQAQPSGDRARRCRLVLIPNRLFALLAAPLAIRSLKSFEAVLRMGADLSGFTPASQLLDAQPQLFPVQPLS